MKSVAQGQCHSEPTTVTFPTTKRHRQLTGAKLYYSTTTAHGDMNHLPRVERSRTGELWIATTAPINAK